MPLQDTITERRPEMGKSFEQSLTSFITAQPAPEMPARPDTGDIEPVLAELLYSFMLWESTHRQASLSLRKLLDAFIDLNELRISLPDELEAVIGRTSKAAERTLRLRMALNQIFLLEHSMSLARLNELSKRDARQYLAELPGIPSFVTSRVSLLALGAHTFPLDERLHRVLIAQKALDPEHDVDQAAQWLERQFRAGEAQDAYLRLEAAAEASRSPAKKPARKAPKKAGAKTRSAKKSAASHKAKTDR